MELFLPEEYPPKYTPKARFVTKMCHPNVDKMERICLDILKNMWTPELQIHTVLLSTQALLSASNPDDLLANDVTKEGRPMEPNQALETVRAWARLCARNIYRSDHQVVHHFCSDKTSPFVCLHPMNTVLETLQTKSQGVFIFDDYMHISKSMSCPDSLLKNMTRG